jgi:parallel beta-helix repeat protein
MRLKSTSKKKIFFVIMLAFCLSLLFTVEPVSSQPPLPTILIQPDGTVSPSSAPIIQKGNTYTFTDNIYSTLKIQKSNIILDGAGHTLYGSYNGTAMDVWVLGEGPDQLPQGILAQYTIGIDLASRTVEGVTISNLNIRNFSIGMYIWTKNNTITGNAVYNNIVGILLSGENETVTQNYISQNQRGLFFGFNNQGDTIPQDIEINHNDFENNVIQLNGCECKDFNTTEPPHCWDNGREGNFWSDYNGTDANNDGIGDTPYVIDLLNLDRYPLMQSPMQPDSPTVISFETIGLGVLAVVVLVAVPLIVWNRRKRL